MIPLIDQNWQELPETYRQWMLAPLPKHVKFFPKDPALDFAILLLPLLWLPLAVFAFDAISKFLHAQRQDSGDVITGIIVTVPLAVGSLYHFFKRLTLHRKLKAGAYRIGLIFDNSTLLWCESLRYCHVLPKHCIKEVEVTARSVHRAGYTPDTFIIYGDTFKLKISANDYAVAAILTFLKSWNERIRINPDSDLQAYFQRHNTDMAGLSG